MSWGIIVDKERFCKRFNREDAIKTAAVLIKNKQQHEYEVGEAYDRDSWMVDCEATEEAERMSS